MGTVISTTPPRPAAPAAPRHGGAGDAGIRRHPVHAKLREIPPADDSVVEPASHTTPHGIEPILMTRHDDPLSVMGRLGERRRFRARRRHRLLAQYVITLGQTPQREFSDETPWACRCR